MSEFGRNAGDAFDWLATELAASMSDPAVWLSFAVALVLAALCTLVGAWVTRRLGLLHPDASPGETLAVALGAGLLAFASAWATVFSVGRSSFTPVAVAMAISVLLGWRSGEHDARGPAGGSIRLLPSGWFRSWTIVAVAAGAFILLTGLLYGITMAPSPRDGLQPIEFYDEAYYSVLGADLARTGSEFLFGPAGFSDLPGIPTQSWYHWGEIWLSAAAITLADLEPTFARHYVALPLTLLAAAALTGVLVRRVSGSPGRGAFLFGALVCLFLAPVPLPGWHFASWARGLVFGITTYGLGVVVILLGLYIVAIRVAAGRPSTPLSLYSGATLVSIIPTHIVLAGLALVGASTLAGVWVASDVIRLGRLRSLPVGIRRVAIATAVIVVATVAWGLVTGHGIGAGGRSQGVDPFGPSWRESLALIALGAGVFHAIPIACVLFWGSPIPSGMFVGALAIVVAGALAWGALLPEFNTFHLFFAGLAVFAAPTAGIAVWMLWRRLRDHGHLRAAATLLFVAGIQLEIAGATTLIGLYQFGHNDAKPISVELLDVIEALPPDAKLAYACGPLEEPSFWSPRLVSITAHTGRRVIPMCFQADVLASLNGAARSADVVHPLFRFAPQRSVFPGSASDPSPAMVAEFLRDHGIHYIYADGDHPNSLVPDATPIADIGGASVFRVPPDPRAASAHEPTLGVAGHPPTGREWVGR